MKIEKDQKLSTSVTNNMNLKMGPFLRKHRNLLFLIHATLLLVGVQCQPQSVSARGQKIQLLPLGQHVDSAVANKLHSILPTISARIWAQLQLVKRELKADLRTLRILLEEHAGVATLQAAGDDPVTITPHPVTSNKSTNCDNPQSYSSTQFEKNITGTMNRLEKLLTNGLVTVSENCVREIEENNQMVFDQQRAMMKSLDQIKQKLDELNLPPTSPSKQLPFPSSNQVRFAKSYRKATYHNAERQNEVYLNNIFLIHLCITHFRTPNDFYRL